MHFNSEVTDNFPAIHASPLFLFFICPIPLKCSSYFLPVAPIKNALYERMQCEQNLVQSCNSHFAL